MSAPVADTHEPEGMLPQQAPFVCRKDVLLWVVTAVALGCLGLYLGVAALRLRYPFELEWIEGGHVDHVRRILAGEPLYARPSVDFIAFIYTPLYFYLSAGLAMLIGVGFPALRLVSFASSLGCFLLLYRLARRETGSRFAGVLAVGFFAATYRLSGGWWDIARVDSLLLLLLLAGIYYLRAEPTPRHLVVAGVLLWLAFLSKQQAAIMGLALAAGVMVHSRRQAGYFLAAFLLPLLVSNLLLNRVFHSWYNYYVWQLPLVHPWNPPAYVTFWTKDLLPSLWLMMGLAAYYLVRQLRGGDRRRGLLYLAALGGVVTSSWMSRLHVGGYVNVIIPAHAMFALLGALGAWEVFALAARKPAGWRRNVVYGLCLLQLAMLHYNPAQFVPTREDAAAGRDFIALLSTLPGEVFVPDHGYLPTLAGKRTYAHGAALVAVLGMTGGDAPSQQLKDELRAAFATHRFGAVVLDTVRPETWAPYYRKQRLVFSKPDVFIPVSGWTIRPNAVYVPAT
jgi:4-amino-4-deoxy-L-arabinose transferase-like glycosyltransferase